MNNITTDSINKRLKALRKSLGLTQKDFGDKLGMQQQAIAMIENSKRSLNKRQIKAICSIYNVNEEWLVNGNGELFVKNEENKISANTINDRLFQLRKKLELSREAFGARIGVSRDVIKNFDYKLTTPKMLQLDLICKEYNINKAWLETGEGEMFNDSQGISGRIKELRKILNITQCDFADAIGFSQSTITMIETNNRDVQDRHIKAICLNYNVDENWLRTGEGEMFRNSSEAERIKVLRKSLKLTQNEFGEKLGLSRDSINNIENKGVPLTVPILKLIEIKYDVNPYWLETGKGSLFKEHYKNIETFIKYIYSTDSNSFKKRFIAMLAALDDDGWLLLQKMVESLVERKDEEEK